MKRRIQKARKWVLLSLILWILWGGYIYFFPPDFLLSLIIFYTLLYTALSLSMRIFVRNVRIYLLPAILILYLLLRQFTFDTILNIALLVAISLTLELYFRRD